MKRYSLLFALSILLSSPAFSQPGINAGIGVNVAFPAADLGDAAATGFGGTAMVKFGLIPLIDVTGGVEYISFTSKDITTTAGSGSSKGHAWGYFVGGRVNVLVIAYAGLELGSYSFTSEFSLPGGPGGSGTNSEFFFAPMAGIELGVFDANLRYVVADGSNFVSLRGMVWF